MLRRLVPVWYIVLPLLCAGNVFAQDYSGMWNQMQRWRLGLDPLPPAHVVETGGGTTVNPPNPVDSPPNTPDIQVFNYPPALYWQSENSIGVNYASPNQLMVSTNGQIPTTPICVWQTWAFSTDGGLTWPTAMQSEAPPSTITGSFGDPVAFFDVSGRAYYVTLGATGGCGTGQGIFVVSTTNFGATWSAQTQADPTAGTNDDKEHAAADFSGTFPNNVYVAWTDFNRTGSPVVFSRSTNQGQTWSTGQVLQISGLRGQGVHIAIGPNGEVYLTWAHYASTGTAEIGVGFAKSTDGGATFSTPTIAYPISGIRTSNGTITQINSRAASFPYHDVDRSNGTRRGWIYVVTPELVSGQADIFVRRSTDGGTTWNSGVKVNGPDVQTGKWQFMPSIAVDPVTGGITVSYYSQDSVGTNFMVNRYAAYSVDGGDTWDNWVISDVRTNWAPQGTPNTNASYNGDYYETTAMGGIAWPLWTDRRSGSTGSSNKAYIERIVYGANFGWVRGTVTNVNGGAPLQGVAIDFTDNVLQQAGTTNASGFYFAGALVDTPATTANRTLRARKFGFLDTLITVTLTRNDTLTRNFALRPLDLVITKESITFPPTPAPGSSVDSLMARNQGTSSLTLSSLTTTNPRFSVSPTSGVIPAGDSLKIRITYSPTVGGTDTGRVIINSTSVFTPRKDVILNGTAIGVPHFTASVDSLVKTLEGGARDSILFRVRNNGTTAGNFAATAIMLPRTGPNGAPAGEPIMIPMTIEQVEAQLSDLRPLVKSSRTDAPSAPIVPMGNPAAPWDRPLGGSHNPPSTNRTLQAMPELMYYKFNEAGGNTTMNFANPGVGTNPAPVTGLTMGGTGQFGSALIGNGLSGNTNTINTGWPTALGTGGWTISMWLNNFPATAATTFYFFGDVGGVLFRCFTGGVAGNNALLLRGTGITDVPVTNIGSAPVVIHFVRETSPASVIKVYKNGVLVNTVTQASPNITGTSFRVGAQSTASNSFPAGCLMDEFRMYSRALSASEIAATWNAELGGGAWFSVSPTEGSIAMGDSITMKAYFDARDSAIYSNPGNYFGRLEVRATNSSLADTLKIPARMFVIPPSGPRLSVAPDSVNFGNVEIGITDSSKTVLVRNIGSGTLNVTNITITNPVFSVSQTSFSLASLDTIRLRLRFAAPSPGGLRTGTMSFVSNDPLAPSVSLRGTSVGVSHIAVTPDSFYFNRPPGSDTTSQTMKLKNTGTDTLRYTITEGLASSLASIERSITQQPSYELAKGEHDPHPGEPPGIDGQGGPDAFGYRWIDSDEPGGPTYNWFDIKAVGTQITTWTGSPDDGYATIALPFSFPFYGTGYTSMNLCTNGFTQFGGGTSTTFTNTAIPSTAVPNNAIYAFWDDLNFNEAGGTAWYYHDAANQRFIVQFDSVSHYLPGTTPGRYTFQMVLKTNGDILCYYRKMEGTVNSSTIGVENSTGTVALQTVFNANYVHDNLALLFTRDLVTWLSANPVEGTLGPGDSTNIQVRVHPSGLAGGTYNARLFVGGNTPDTGRVRIRLDVITGVEELAHLVPTQYSLDQNYPNPFNPSTRIQFALPQESTVKLKVFNLLGQEVITLADEVRPAGYFFTEWNGTNSLGSRVSSGVFFYRMEATAVSGNRSFVSVKKMLLLK
jgi:hypothetical protein